MATERRTLNCISLSPQTKPQAPDELVVQIHLEAADLLAELLASNSASRLLATFVRAPPLVCRLYAPACHSQSASISVSI